MGAEENKMLTQRLYEEVINQGNLDLADAFIPADGVENEAVNDSRLEFF